MILYILAVCLIYIAFKKVIQPYIHYRSYVKHFKSQGYRVMSKFRPFSLQAVKYYNYSQDAKDGLYYIKKEFPGYDVVIMNMMEYILIDVIHPDLQQEFFTPDKVEFYEKGTLEREGLSKVMGYGLLISEGKEWKKKRKVIT